MSQISWRSYDPAAAPPPSGTAAASSDGVLARISPGQILQAQVLKALGNSLFEIKLAGQSVITSSNAPLAAGQALTLQAGGTQQGKPVLRVLTLAEGEIAKVSQPPTPPTDGDAPASGQTAAPATRSALAATVAKDLSTPSLASASASSTPSAGTSQTANDVAVFVELSPSTQFSAANGAPSPASAPPGPPPALNPSFAGLVKANGPVAQLLAQRPDLQARVQDLLTQFQNQPAGLGTGIERLLQQVSSLSARATPTLQAALNTTQNRLVGQLLTPAMLDHPEALAQTFGDRIGQLAQGLESLLTRYLPQPATVNDLSASQDSGDATSFLLDQRTAGLLAESDKLAGPTNRSDPPATTSADPNAANATSSAHQANPSAPSPTHAAERSQPLVQGTFDGDLKGQLLQLRDQLTAMAQQPGQTATTVQQAQQAVQQTNTLIDQLTSQQLRNVDGLNQYMHVNLPIDPRTGIDAARLQVFYRKKGASAVAADDRFTVALFLNMTKLGNVLAVVSGVDRAVTVGFTVNDRATEQLLQAQTQSLRDALVAAGHSGATVTVRQAPPKASPAEAAGPVWQAFLSAAPQEGDPGAQLNRKA